MNQIQISTCWTCPCPVRGGCQSRTPAGSSLARETECYKKISEMGNTDVNNFFLGASVSDSKSFTVD